MAGRYRPPTNLGPAPPAGRFQGLCSACTTYHREPDLRYHCHVCVGSFCLGQVHRSCFAMVCPDCGTRVDVDEGTGE